MKRVVDSIRQRANKRKIVCEALRQMLESYDYIEEKCRLL